MEILGEMNFSWGVCNDVVNDVNTKCLKEGIFVKNTLSNADI